MVLLSLYGETIELVPVAPGQVKLSVWTPTEHWSRTAPFLDAGEARRLAEWLRAAAANDAEADPFLSFADPGLEFEFVMGDPERLIRLKTDRGTINLMVSRKSLNTAADDLQREANQLC